LPSEDVSAWPEYLRKKMERGEVQEVSLMVDNKSHIIYDVVYDIINGGCYDSIRS
jgi:hypothetical protein